jgi:hypothetical protein
MNSYYDENPRLKQVFYTTKILKKPISGIISGYHILSYILVAPDDSNPSYSIEINGKINVSPKFIISPSALSETFGDIFDPETFDKNIEGRLFSFAYKNNKNIRIENEYFSIKNYQENPNDHVERIHDKLLMQENITTGLIFGPHFKYYPVSIDRFINEILDREFRV